MPANAGGERWASRIGLIFAMAGNAVGLGNFLRFPAQAVANGGGAFIIPYLVSFVLMGIPLLWIEWGLGRYGGKYDHHSGPGILDVMGKSKVLKYFGVFGIFTNLAILSYYVYIESWTLSYVWFSISGTFQDMTAPEVSQFFLNYLDVGGEGIIDFSYIAIAVFLVTIGINLFILSQGLAKGIERAGKILLPLLVIFGVFLTIRALTLEAGEAGAINDAVEGLSFLWTPQFDTLANPNVWLAAAGQVFFTLSVGMGSILCYASYVRENEDIALNATTAGFTNEFVEVVLGGSIIIPIAVAYLGLPWLEENVGFAMGFMTMPTLFQNWGPFLGAVGGLLWFGLLFFAGITSSLAMGQPVISFIQNKFDISKLKTVAIFGTVLFILALPCVLLYELGAFDEYDYWAGTFSLVLFALGETIIFSWVFGIDKAWNEIQRGSELKIPFFFKYVIKYVTPVFILAVFIGALIQPMNDDWGGAFTSLFNGDGWPFAPLSVIGKLLHVGVENPDAIMVTNIVRGLLLLTFIGVGVLIYMAWKRNPELNKLGREE